MTSGTRSPIKIDGQSSPRLISNWSCWHRWQRSSCQHHPERIGARVVDPTAQTIKKIHATLYEGVVNSGISLMVCANFEVEFVSSWSRVRLLFLPVEKGWDALEDTVQRRFEERPENQ